MKKYLSPFLLVVAGLAISFTSRGQKATPTLNHIAHYVVDLKVSANFYMHIVGLDSIPEPFHDGKHVWLSVGYKSHLHLIQGAAGPYSLPKNSHLCFTVPSVTDFIKMLDTNKIEYENWAGDKMSVTNRVDGVKQIYFKDPDGYWLEINDAKD
jgi:lactoylglutathione lyase